MGSEPFRQKVVDLNRTMRFSDMAHECNDARSSAWWNNVKNGQRVAPPPPEILDDIGRLFGVPAERVAEMVAEQWYGISPTADLSMRVRAIGSSLDALSDRDYALVESLVHRLAKGDGS